MSAYTVTEAEQRGKLRTERGVQVYSAQYGLTGKLDLLEIKSGPEQLTPVEYKARQTQDG